MSNMKAIETFFDGYKFRSRLEARWAVFFKTLGIKYEYEKEGYNLDGVWYLPDFWLPELQRWIEIKGEEPTGEEINKLEMLAHDTDYPSCLFYGLPGENEGIAYYTCSHESNAGDSETKELTWGVCPLCLSADVILRHKEDCSLYRSEGEMHNSCIYGGGTDCVDKFLSLARSAADLISREAREYDTIGDVWGDLVAARVKVRLPFSMHYDLSHPFLTSAYTAARQARFEHGEKG